MRRVVFLVPGGLDRVTGGNVYDLAMIEELRARGWTVDAREPDLPRDDEGLLVVDSLAFRFGRPQGRPPYVALVHQMPSAAAGFPEPTVQERDVFRFATLVITVSDWLAEHVGRFTNAPVVVVPPGRDRARGEETRDPSSVLVVSNAVPGKGVPDAIDAFARAAAGDTPLVLVGDLDRDPGEATRVREAVDRCNAPVERAGVLAANEVAERYARAKVLLTASRYEGRPIAVIEAMANGVPVCGYDVPGVRELVRTGRDGVLARPGDVDDLAACLRDMLEDDDLRRAMGHAAERRSQSWPTWKESAIRFAEALESLPGP